MAYSKPIGFVFALLLLLVIGSATPDAAQSSPAPETVAPPDIEVAAEAVTLHRNEGLVYYQNRPFSGYTVRYYANGQPAERIGYLGGKKQGLRQQWYPDGTPKLQVNYRNGKYHGESLSWWANGNLRTKGTFVDGVIEGTYTQWYREGMIFKQMNYRAGKEAGMQRAWRQNGKIYNNYEVKNGRIFGLKRANLCYGLDDEKIIE
jgi:antitoxin component YwqK of YwqJK toxin-antitoxin module